MRWALHLAEQGMLVFPLRPGSKRPYADEQWSEVMTTAPDTIREWFTHRPNMNYGVCPGDNGLVLDPDVKGDVSGIAILDTLAAGADDWAGLETLTVRTPSGGFHIYFRHSTSPRTNANTFPDGVDVRGARGYVVGPGSELIEGKCGNRDTPGSYEIVKDLAIAMAPVWVLDRTKKGEGREAGVGPRALVELDLPENVRKAETFIRSREPAIQDCGGDDHTWATAARVIDFGISVSTCIEIMTEPYQLDGEGPDQAQSWNDRCAPPWNVYGGDDTLETKVRNAWNHRARDVGEKAGGDFANQFGGIDLNEVEDYQNIISLAKYRRHAPDRARDGVERGAPTEPRANRWAGSPLRVAEAVAVVGHAEMVIPGWLRVGGFTACLARRGTGKSVCLTDLALSLATDRQWQGQPATEGLYTFMMAGEDAEGALDHARAWLAHHGVTAPERFRFVPQVPDLLDSADVEACARFIRSAMPDGARALLVLDTWQRSTARASQNDDDAMQLATDNVERLARTVNGQAITAHHPPKGSDATIMGSSIIENATRGIWTVTDHHGQKRIEVARLKGRGEGNYRIVNFRSVGLGEADSFGQERTGAVAVPIGGVEADEHAREIAEAYARLIAAKIRHHLTLPQEERVRQWTVAETAKQIGGARLDIDGGTGKADSARSLRDKLPEMFNQPVALGDGMEVALVPTGETRGKGSVRKFELRQASRPDTEFDG